MKAEVIKNEDVIKFPCLMESPEVVILAIRQVDRFISGTVLKEKMGPGHGCYPVGNYYQIWNAAVFKKMTGKLVLSNEDCA